MRFPKISYGKIRKILDSDLLIFSEAMYHAYRRMEIRDHRLLYLFFELTRRCNLSCIHCGSDCSSKNGEDLMDESKWIAVIDHISKRFTSPPSIVLTGGEPLLLEWLEDLGAYIHKKKMRWGLVTNGLLLDKARLRSIELSGVESVTISLDGKETTHDVMRGKTGAWLDAMRAICLLGASSIPVRDVVTCVSPSVFKDLDELASVLSSKGITSWRLFRIFPKGRALNNPELFLDKPTYLELLGWIRKNRPIFAQAGIELSLSCDGWLPFEIDRRVRSMPFFCRSGIQIASILNDGRITGCPNNDTEFTQGNFFEVDFESVWKKEFAVFRRRQWLKQTTCVTCTSFAGCKGGSMHSWISGSQSPTQCWEIN